MLLIEVVLGVVFGTVAVIVTVVTVVVAKSQKKKRYGPVMTDYSPGEVVEMVTTEMVSKGATITDKTTTTATFSKRAPAFLGSLERATVVASDLHGETKVVTSGEGDLRRSLKHTIDQHLGQSQRK